MCRPWEAPEQVLQDAGVELGVTYPYPIISQEDSQKTLEWASQVIQKTLLNNVNAKVDCLILHCFDLSYFGQPSNPHPLRCHVFYSGVYT